MRIQFKILSLLAILVLSICVAAQQRLGGKVVEVIDGRTLVIEMANGKVTAVIEYIEIPEPEQALNWTMKEHLKALVLNKNVEFRARGLMPAKTMGQVYLQGVDIGQQMVRDGAAWHIPAERTGQDQVEGETYEKNEALAKAEKRGIWSVADLKPAWEFRAAKAEAARQEEERQWQNASITTRPGPNVGPSRVSGGISNAGALINKYNRETKTGSLTTPVLGVTDPDTSRKTAAAVGYFYKEDNRGHRTGYYSIILMSSAARARFRSSDLSVTVDEKRVAVIRAKRTEKKDDEANLNETLEYVVGRSVIEKMANGSVVIMKISDYPIILLPSAQRLLYNVLDVSK